MGFQETPTSWSSYGAWQHTLNGTTDELPFTEKKKVDELIQGMTDKREIVKTLYHHLQDNHRYINVRIGVGGFKPYSASYVCQNRYGDCKALTIYMKALLKYAEIPAYFTVINSGENARRIDPDLPQPQFNHVVLTVPLEGDTIWLENTNNLIPYNYVGTYNQNRKALLVNGTESRLIEAPKFRLEDVLEADRYKFKLNEDGVGEVEVSRKLKGKTFQKYLSMKDNWSEEEQETELKDDINVNEFTLDQWQITQEDRDMDQIQVSVKGSCSDQFRKISNLKVIRVPALELPQVEKPKDRKRDVRVNFPINELDSAQYELPFLSDYEVEVPEDFEIASEYGYYMEAYKVSDDRISVTRNFQLFAGDYPVKEYDQFYAFLEEVKLKIRKSAIILTTN